MIDVFVAALDLAEMSFEGVEPAATGRPSYHPSVLLKLYKAMDDARSSVSIATVQTRSNQRR